MDYFHADRRPVWRRSPGPDAFCAEQYRSMAFAQLTYRESLSTSRPASRSTHRNSITQPVRRSDAGRCQRKARLAYPCGVGPAAHQGATLRRRTGARPDQYRLRPGLDDHRSVPVGLSVGALPHHQGGGEDAQRCSTCGATFRPHLGWQAARRSCPRYALAGSRSHLRRGSWRDRLCPPLCVAPSRGLLRHACQVEHRCSIRRRRIADRHHLPDHLPGRRITPNFCGASARTPSGLHHQQLLASSTICALYKSRWQVELFFKWIKQHLRIKQFYFVGNAVKTQIWIAVSVYVLVAIVKKRLDRRLALHFVTDPLGDPLRENAHTSSTCGRRMQRFANNQPIEFIRFLTGH